MKSKLFDVHTHLNFKAFEGDFQEVIERALKNDIWLINVGSQFSTSQRAVEIAQNYKNGIYATIGLHPIHVFDENFDEKKYFESAKNEKVVAIGECGLDYYRLAQDVDCEEQIAKQKEIFIKQIELAKEVKKPLMIHCRDAHKDLLEILKENRNLLIPKRAGIMHFFGGNGAWENVDEYLNLGFYISFSGVITFPKYSHFEDIRRLPFDRILIETDAPFVSPEPYRGQRNEPVYIIETAKKMAEIKEVSFERIAEQTVKNVSVVFGLKI